MPMQELIDYLLTIKQVDESDLNESLELMAHWPEREKKSVLTAIYF